MIEQEYIQPGRYTDDAGHEIVVTGRQTPDGRYEVEYPKMNDRRTILSASTLRRFYAVAGVAAALALLPAAALAAKTPQATAKAFVQQAFQRLYNQTGGLETPLKIVCAGPASHIVCTGSSIDSTGDPWKYVETVSVHAGKVKVLRTIGGARS